MADGWQGSTQNTAISEPIIIEKLEQKPLFCDGENWSECDVWPWCDVSEKWRVLVHLSMLIFKTRNFYI